MKLTTITLLDREPVVGTRGLILTTDALRLPANFNPMRWAVEGEKLLGRSAVKATIQYASEPTTWMVVDDVELHDEGLHWHELTRPRYPLLRVCVEILSDEIPDAEWVEPPARLLLTVRVHGTQEGAGPIVG
jgi:hypothetical protein